MKRFCVLILVFALLLPALACASASPQPVYEHPGWETAEDAVQNYLEGLKNGDVSQMLDSFSIETYIDRFDLTAYFERFKAILPGTSREVKLYSTNPFFRQLNIEARRGEIMRMITMQVMSFEWPEMDHTKSIPQGQAYDATIQAMLAVHVPTLSDLSFEAFLDPAALSDVYESPANRGNHEKQLALLGTEEIKSVAARFTAGGGTYLFCCDAARYGDKWYISSFGGNIGALLGVAALQAGIARVE